MEKCYRCDSISEGKDHVPPRCFFPKDGSLLNLIKVPSCPLHNTKQSSADEYLKFVLSTTSTHVSSDIVNSTIRGIVRLVKKESRAIEKYGITKESDRYLISNDFEVNHALICECLEKIAFGIYYYHNNFLKKLDSPVKVLPIFLGTDPDCPTDLKNHLEEISFATQADIKELPLYGNHKEIFAYQVLEGDNIIVINLVFYKEKLASIIHIK